MREITEEMIMDVITRAEEIVEAAKSQPVNTPKWYVDDDGNLVGGFGNAEEAVNWIGLTFLYLTLEDRRARRQTRPHYGGSSGLPN